MIVPLIKRFKTSLRYIIEYEHANKPNILLYIIKICRKMGNMRFYSFDFLTQFNDTNYGYNTNIILSFDFIVLKKKKPCTVVYYSHL